MLKNSFYFIRHGETDWNREDRNMGQQDIPLNANGILQAKQASLLLKKSNIKTICHSPLKRAKETAIILNDLLDCSLIEIDALKECCWGILEGQLKGDRQALNQWIEGITPPGAETWHMFKERAMNALDLSLIYPNPIIVSHGGIYWALQQLLCKTNHHHNAQNCHPILFSKLVENEAWVATSLENIFDEEPFET